MTTTNNPNTLTAPALTTPTATKQPSIRATILIPLALCAVGYLIFELISQGLETLRALDALIVYS
jgi:hypothetical protein